MAEAIAGQEEQSELPQGPVMDMSNSDNDAQSGVVDEVQTADIAGSSDSADNFDRAGAVDTTENSRPDFIQASLDVPKDFANRVASKITAINERELDEEIALAKVAALIYKNMNHPEALPYFNETIDILLQDEHTQKYAATTWTSLLWNEDIHPEYRKLVNAILDRSIGGHIRADLPMYEAEESGKEFSAYAYTLGETFIQMMGMNSDLYNILTDIYSYLIRSEMSRDLEKGKEESSKKRTILSRKKSKESEVKNPKKLFDDIVDYISERGEFRSDTLEQKNPNEFILILADQLRSTRRYIIQDIMNRHALERKKTLEKELRDRQASAEEVIQAGDPFRHGLYLFWLEKRYNFKYLAVEKVRITLQIVSIFLGLGAVGIGFLAVGPIGLFEGLMVGGMMTIYSQFFCSRAVFGPFYPKDVTVELEKDVGAYTPTFRKMTLEQMNSFMNRQLKEPESTLLLHLLPEYVKYIFAVMPDRNEILMTKENVNEFMERLEVNLTKYQRSK